ncbi:DoxX family protein [Salinactinospora qingdaonensis]|uniref:DoxX family protein n=1 Tax=Salinactinospora qingdaonensis TaxID=702744 RepID=A0ABP7FQ12_9ACTN
MDVDIGMLVVRLALGPMLFVHGWNKAMGSGGLAGTTRWFGSMGLRPAWLHARLAAFTEMGAGALVTVGLLTTPAAAAFVGVMAVATFTDHRGKGYFVFKGGWEYTLLIAMVAVALACVGPGAWSLDRVLGIELTGVLWAGAALLVGLAAAAALLLACYRGRR